MTEKEYALKLKNEYENAQKQLGNVLIFRNLKQLENDYHFNFSKLKEEIEKLGYHFELVTSLNDKKLEKLVQNEYSCCFFKNQYTI